MSSSRCLQRSLLVLARHLSLPRNSNVPLSNTTRSIVTVKRRVVRANRQTDVNTIPDPLPLDNPNANPIILLQNSLALRNLNAALKAYDLCKAQPALLAQLSSEDVARLLQALHDASLHTPSEMLAKAGQFQKDLLAAGVRPSVDIDAALIRLLGAAKNLAGAVRHAKAALAADRPADETAKIYDALIRVLSTQGRPKVAAALLKKMVTKGIAPTADIYATIIAGYADVGSMNEAVEAYQQMLAAGLPATEEAIVPLINGFGALGRITNAHKYFNELTKRGLSQNTEAWTGMIRAHAVKGNVGDTVNLYRRMRSAGLEASPETYTYIIQAHSKAKDVAGANRFFYKKETVKGFRPSPAMYAAMIEAYASNGQMDLAWRMLGDAYRALETDFPSRFVISLAVDLIGKNPSYLRDMQKLAGIDANRYTSVAGSLMEALLQTDVQSGAETVLTIYGMQDVGNGPESASIHGLAAIAYTSKGDLEAARKTLESLEDVEQASVKQAFASLLIGYAKKGDTEGALKLFEEMKTRNISADGAVYEVLLRLGDNAVSNRLMEEVVQLGIVPNERTEPVLAAAVKIEDIL